MKQISRHVLLIHFIHEDTKAHGSPCLTQVTRVSGSRTQVPCLRVLLRTAQCHSRPGPKLEHCSVESFLLVGYKWYIILIAYAYFQRKDFTPILCQCYFNVWHYIAGCILLHEKKYRKKCLHVSIFADPF